MDHIEFEKKIYRFLTWCSGVLTILMFLMVYGLPTPKGSEDFIWHWIVFALFICCLVKYKFNIDLLPYIGKLYLGICFICLCIAGIITFFVLML